MTARPNRKSRVSRRSLSAIPPTTAVTIFHRSLQKKTRAAAIAPTWMIAVNAVMSAARRGGPRAGGGGRGGGAGGRRGGGGPRGGGGGGGGGRGGAWVCLIA